MPYSPPHNPVGNSGTGTSLGNNPYGPPDQYAPVVNPGGGSIPVGGGVLGVGGYRPPHLSVGNGGHGQTVYHGAQGGSGGASLGPSGGAVMGAQAPAGASAAWRAQREAQIAKRREGLKPEDMAGFRTDAEGKRYWYQPGIDAAAANNPINKEWAYGLANPTGAFATRQFAGQGPAPFRAYLAPPPVTPPDAGGGGQGPGLHSVVDSPSTHPYTPPPAPSPAPGGGGTSATPPPSGGGSVPAQPGQQPVMAAQPRYFPIGQSTPGFGGASTPLQVAGMPGAGGQGQQPGGKPAGQPGFDPATAPTSAAAKQQGSAYQARQSTAQRQQQTKTALATPGGANPYNRRYTAANPYQPTPARY